MTTISYKDGVISYDSRATTESGTIIDDNFNKKVVVNKDVIAFFCGDVHGIETLIDMYMNNIPEISLKNIDCQSFIVDHGEVSMVGLCDGELFINTLDLKKHYSIGSGSQHALTAMDLGLTSKESIKMAIKRNSYTGGKINSYKIKNYIKNPKKTKKSQKKNTI